MDSRLHAALNVYVNILRQLSVISKPRTNVWRTACEHKIKKERKNSRVASMVTTLTDRIKRHFGYIRCRV